MKGIKNFVKNYASNFIDSAYVFLTGDSQTQSSSNLLKSVIVVTSVMQFQLFMLLKRIYQSPRFEETIVNILDHTTKSITSGVALGVTLNVLEVSEDILDYNPGLTLIVTNFALADIFYLLRIRSALPNEQRQDDIVSYANFTKFNLVFELLYILITCLLLRKHYSLLKSPFISPDQENDPTAETSQHGNPALPFGIIACNLVKQAHIATRDDLHTLMGHYKNSIAGLFSCCRRTRQGEPQESLMQRGIQLPNITI